MPLTELQLKEPSFPHQQKAYELQRDKQFFALFMEQGTGKTKVMIDTASYLYTEGKITAGLVLCPNGIQENWHYREIPKFCSVPYETDFRSSYNEIYKRADKLLDNGGPKGRGSLLWLSANIDWVMMKQGFLFLTHFLQNHRTLLIVDESTLIKNPNAQRTKKVMELGRKASYRRILTGTPSPQGPVDLYSQMKFLDESILPYPSFTAFKNTFCVMRLRALANGRSFQELLGYRNVDLLSKITAPYIFRVLKKDCLELPEKLYKTYFTSFHKEQEKIYHDVKEKLIAELEHQKVTVANATAAMMKLQQILSGFIVDETGTAIRVPTQRYSDVLRYFFPSEAGDADHLRDENGFPKKTIIFFRFKAEIEIFKKALKVTGDLLPKKHYAYEYVEYTGDISAEDRNAAVDKFQNTPQCLMFLATSAAARGLTLTSAKRVIYFSQDYNLETRLQSEDRAHRIGQTDDVEYWNVCLPKTVDEKIQKALDKKLNISNELTTNWRSFFE